MQNLYNCCFSFYLACCERRIIMYRTKVQMAEETRMCRNADIMQIARSMGIELRRRGSVYEDKAEHGVRIYPNTNSFYDFYNAAGGSPIDLVCKYRDCGIGEAVQFILSEIGYDRTYEHQHDHATDRGNSEYMRSGVVGRKNGSGRTELDIPPHALNNRRLFAYLNKTRHIDAPVIQQMLHDHLIYETDRHNIAFVANDEKGQPAHIFQRGTVTDKVWRGDTAGSDKEYGFTYGSGSDELVVFEAPIDLMSYLCLRKEDRNEDLLALGMLDDGPIDKYLAFHPGIKTIHFFLDNDAPGTAFSQNMMLKYSDKGYKCTNYLMGELAKKGCKDVNDYLIQKRGSVIKAEGKARC